MGLPTWIVAPVKLIAAAVRHPNTAQVMIIRDGRVEVDLTEAGKA